MPKRPPRLACCAPVAYRTFLLENLAAGGIQGLFFPRPTPRGTGAPREGDPYRIEKLARSLGETVDGILLIVSRTQSAHHCVPGPVIGGLPVGLLFSNHPADLSRWARAVADPQQGRPTWAVLAMWRQSYLTIGKRFARWLRGTNPRTVETWLADSITRTELCQRLADGPRFVVYMGHGRSRGLSGYLGVRWEHIAQVPSRAPCGTIVCFACDTVKRESPALPFGYRWVSSGRSVTYVGSVDAVSVPGNARLVHEIGALFAAGGISTLGKLLMALDHRLRQHTSLLEAQETFQTYRIIGNPIQPLS